MFSLFSKHQWLVNKRKTTLQELNTCSGKNSVALTDDNVDSELLTHVQPNDRDTVQGTLAYYK